jgi:outer membrane receptor protein involved in Fe transport
LQHRFRGEGNTFEFRTGETRRMKRFALLSLVLCSAPVIAQEAPAPEEAEGDEAPRPQPGEIVVIANRLRDQVDAPQQPIVTYDEADIAAYGASSIADLIASTAPQTGSGRGRGGGFPSILFNGQRITNFREFRNIPPEAIRRMEVLPEEVALRYGFQANQRVINFILKDNFASK